MSDGSPRDQVRADVAVELDNLVRGARGPEHRAAHEAGCVDCPGEEVMAVEVAPMIFTARITPEG